MTLDGHFNDFTLGIVFGPIYGACGFWRQLWENGSRYVYNLGGRNVAQGVTLVSYNVRFVWKLTEVPWSAKNIAERLLWCFILTRSVYSICSRVLLMCCLTMLRSGEWSDKSLN